MRNPLGTIATRVNRSPDPSGDGGSLIGGSVTAGTAGSQPGQHLADAKAKTNADIAGVANAVGAAPQTDHDFGNKAVPVPGGPDPRKE